MKSDFRGHLFALFAVICWGTSFLVSKTLMDNMSALQLIWVRFLIAWVALWGLHPKWNFHWKEEGYFFVCSLFSNTLYFLAENTALLYTQTSNVSILTSTIPLMTAILLFAVKGQRLEKSQITGYLVAFAGVVLVILNGVFILKLGGIGDLLALGAALSWSVYSILVQNIIDRYNGFLLARKLMFYGFVTITPIMLLTGGAFDPSAIFGGGNLFRFLYLGVICSALCYVLWNESIRVLDVSVTNTYLYVMPLMTLFAGAVFLHERVTLMGLTGTALVIAGMLISNRPAANKKKQGSV